jgi:hypothetical protein
MYDKLRTVRTFVLKDLTHCTQYVYENKIVQCRRHALSAASIIGGFDFL